MAARPSGAVARVRDLSVEYRRGKERVPALRGVNLAIERGECLAIVGESGSGKSTLGLSLLGLLPRPPEASVSGEVEVDGVDMIGAGPADLRRVRRLELGAIFQDPMTP
jgi:peptide/nickel transport system ATP-binding protein